MSLADQVNVKYPSPKRNSNSNEPGDRMKDFFRKTNLANDNSFHQINKDMLVIGEVQVFDAISISRIQICGQNMSEISGVRQVSCSRRGSVISHPIAPTASEHSDSVAVYVLAFHFE